MRLLEPLRALKVSERLMQHQSNEAQPRGHRKIDQLKIKTKEKVEKANKRMRALDRL